MASSTAVIEPLAARLSWKLGWAVPIRVAGSLSGLIVPRLAVLGKAVLPGVRPPGVAAQALNWALRFLVREAIAASVSFFWTWMVVVDVPPVVAFGLDTLSRTEL